MGGGYNIDDLGINCTTVTSTGNPSFICLGYPYAEWIIQGGIVKNTVQDGTGCYISFPISFKKYVLSVVCTDGGNGCYYHGTSLNNSSGFTVYARNGINNNFTLSTFNYIAIGV